MYGSGKSADDGGRRGNVDLTSIISHEYGHFIGDHILGSPSHPGYGYNDDPERFKGTFLPGKGSTPAALSGWAKDGDGLKIDSPGVALVPAGGAEVPPHFGEQPQILHRILKARLDRKSVV